MNHSRADRFVSYSIGLSALVITGVFVYRTFGTTVRTVDGVVAPTLVAGWEEGIPIGRHVAGEADAPVTILEFTDLECSACRGFQARLDSVLVSRAGKVKLVYLPFPLAQLHRFALPAARFAECAYREERLGEWIAAVYAAQDSLGLKSWTSLASNIGIVDTLSFVACAQAPTVNAGIALGIAFGQRLEVVATPTVVVNGWRFARPPTVDTLERLIDELVAEGTKSGGAK